MLPLALLAYATALVLANLIVAAFVKTAPQYLPLVTGVNAFLLIGLDLALRDWLHTRLKPMQMLMLILSTGVITYVLNPTAGQIALASSGAFLAAALADWWVFTKSQGTWAQRSLKSNIAGAAVDSVLFSALAPFGFVLAIVLTQFVAKAAGGTVWTWLVKRWAPVRA